MTTLSIEETRRLLGAEQPIPVEQMYGVLGVNPFPFGLGKSMIKTHPTYQEIHDTCLTLKSYEQIEIPDLIIGLTRGGLVPAVLISHDMNIPMEAVNYSSLQGRGDNAGEHTNVIPRFPDADRLLIVDDICDTGYTMQELVEEYTRRGHEVQTFTLYWKESSVFIPTMFWQQIPHDSEWIIFPWEPVPPAGEYKSPLGIDA